MGRVRAPVPSTIERMATFIPPTPEFVIRRMAASSATHRRMPEAIGFDRTQPLTGRDAVVFQRISSASSAMARTDVPLAGLTRDYTRRVFGFGLAGAPGSVRSRANLGISQVARGVHAEEVARSVFCP